MTKIKIALILSLVAIPSLVLGAGMPPSNVQGVHVSSANGIITVTWQPAKDDTGVAFYRVYYSRTSILENDGNYDDFERTRGAETAYSFTKVPVQGERIFASVLAVDTDGNESEGFEAEASTALSSTATTPVIAETKPPSMEQIPPAAAPVSDPTPMMYTAVTPVSATGLIVSFSKEIDTAKSIDATSFQVKDGSGKVLAVQKVEVHGVNIHLTIEPQTPMKLYTLTLATAVRAKDGSELPSSTPGVQFVGFVTTSVLEPSVTEKPVEQVQQVYVKNPLFVARDTVTPFTVHLSPVEQKNGLYTVVARWQGGTTNPAGYTVSISRNGTDFDEPMHVSATTESLQFENVKPGSGFTVRVEQHGKEGEMEHSNFSSLKLPETGIGLFGIVLVAGALAMYRQKKWMQSC